MIRTKILLTLLMLPGSAFAQQGAWEPVFSFGVQNDPLRQPIIAVHLVHVFDALNPLDGGKVLAHTQQIGGDPAHPTVPNCFPPLSLRWTPDVGPGVPGSFDRVEYCRTDVFCAGHSALADGWIFHAGGDYMVDLNRVPLPHGNLFDPSRSMFPVSNQWNDNESAIPPDKIYARCRSLFSNPRRSARRSNKFRSSRC